MSKRAATWDAKEMFLRGLMAFGRVFGSSPNPLNEQTEQVHRTKDEDRKRRKTHAQFKAQRLARRKQRQLMKVRA